MQAEIRFEVAQMTTDKEYAGIAHVAIPERNIRYEFPFMVFDPNNLAKFRVTIEKGGVTFLESTGARPIRQEIASYNDHQVAIFILLFPSIISAVSQAQLAYGGTTVAKPLAGVVEDIKFVGSEVLATIAMTKQFSWEPEDREHFEAVCQACS